ncbi:hypothetical protein PR202_ga31212 [Eleusine coracana subsp. coracana]|uniref:Uncharacterized protein n=1 Tax=Eleusine coracana subsp. coracana TaxID=191504 RepID=A0AAV5DR17_ELECO|nr:hypothetical protein PR202_ga31212 [Eleusine coracana subsp. coracana]
MNWTNPFLPEIGDKEEPHRPIMEIGSFPHGGGNSEGCKEDRASIGSGLGQIRDSARKIKESQANRSSLNRDQPWKEDGESIPWGMAKLRANRTKVQKNGDRKQPTDEEWMEEDDLLETDSREMDLHNKLQCNYESKLGGNVETGSGRNEGRMPGVLKKFGEQFSRIGGKGGIPRMHHGDAGRGNKMDQDHGDQSRGERFNQMQGDLGRGNRNGQGRLGTGREKA